MSERLEEVIAKALHDFALTLPEDSNGRGLLFSQRHGAARAIAVAISPQLSSAETLRAALRLVDDDVRHHLRSDAIAPALLRPHAIDAVRAALRKCEPEKITNPLSPVSNG